MPSRVLPKLFGLTITENGGENARPPERKIVSKSLESIIRSAGGRMAIDGLLLGSKALSGLDPLHVAPLSQGGPLLYAFFSGNREYGRASSGSVDMFAS